MSDKVKVTFEFNDTNYHGAYREHLRHRNKMWIYIRSILCILIIGFGAYLMVAYAQKQSTGGNTFFGPLFVTAGSIGFLRPMIWQMWHERNVRKNPNYGSEIQYTFDHTGIKVSGEKGEYSLPWEKLYEYVIRSKGLLIYIDKKRFLWVPKKVFKENQWIAIVKFEKSK